MCAHFQLMVLFPVIQKSKAIRNGFSHAAISTAINMPAIEPLYIHCLLSHCYRGTALLSSSMRSFHWCTSSLPHSYPQGHSSTMLPFSLWPISFFTTSFTWAQKFNVLFASFFKASRPHNPFWKTLFPIGKLLKAYSYPPCLPSLLSSFPIRLLFPLHQNGSGEGQHC